MMKNTKFASITKEGKVVMFNGTDVTENVKASSLKTAIAKGETIMFLGDDGNWKREAYMPAAEKQAAKEQAKAARLKEYANATPIMKLIQAGVDKKPDDLFITPLKWKYLVRAIVRGKNVLMTGGTGTGKTYTAKEAAKALGRPLNYFNLGATQDARSTLIGNTHFKGGTSEDSGTFFNQSLFIKAIQIPNSVILLDELSRANPEAWNILMPVLDEGQRYLRLDEEENSPTIKVAEGVTFIGTANIGAEFTSTRVMDRALLDRFTIVEVDYLPKEGEEQLIRSEFPDLREAAVKAIADIAQMSRDAIGVEDAKIDTPISTRSTLELAGLMVDGFLLSEAAEVAIYPFYDTEGDMDSERTFVKQMVQKHSHIDKPPVTDEAGKVVEEGDGEELFALDEDSF